jgi:hypothetical protein
MHLGLPLIVIARLILPSEFPAQFKKNQGFWSGRRWVSGKK